MVDAEGQRHFDHELSSCRGCYVLCLRPSGGPGFIPVYVGKTVKQSFGKRAFKGKDKPALYAKIRKDYQKASVHLFLLPLLTPSGRPSRKGTNDRVISAVEIMLIHSAMKNNDQLWNTQHKVGMEKFTVDGFHNQSGKQSASAIALGQCVGV